jgi:hypothetical protein
MAAAARNSSVACNRGTTNENSPAEAGLFVMLSPSARGGAGRTGRCASRSAGRLRVGYCTAVGLIVVFSITTSAGCDSALHCIPATVLPSTTAVVMRAIAKDIRRAWVEIVFMVGPFVRFVDRAAMKRTLGIRSPRRERIATERRDRGVNCRAVSRRPAVGSTVHSGLMPFRRALVQFSPDFHRRQGLVA